MNDYALSGDHRAREQDAEPRPRECVHDRAEIASGDIAIVPERGSQLERAGRREPNHAGMGEIHQALRRNRAGTRHKEEKGNGCRAPERQHGCEGAAPDGCRREHTRGRPRGLPPDRHSRCDHQTRRRHDGGEIPAGRDRERGRRMRESDAERGLIALTRGSVSSSDHGAECARMERDGERIETVTAQPDKQDAET